MKKKWTYTHEQYINRDLHFIAGAMIGAGVADSAWLDAPTYTDNDAVIAIGSAHMHWISIKDGELYLTSEYDNDYTQKYSDYISSFIARGRNATL